MGGGSLLEGRNRLADEAHEDDRAEDGRHSLNDSAPLQLTAVKPIFGIATS